MADVIKTLEEIYLESSKPGIVKARAQAGGQEAVNFFEAGAGNQSFGTDFITRTPGDTRTWDKPRGENSHFTPRADDFYEEEATSLGTDAKSNFKTEFNAADPSTSFISRYANKPGVVYSNSSVSIT